MKTVRLIIGAILLAIGIYRFIGIWESYRMFGALLDNPWSQKMMHGEICLAIVLCLTGLLFLTWSDVKKAYLWGQGAPTARIKQGESYKSEAWELHLKNKAKGEKVKETR